MNTPIYSFVKDYSEKKASRLHMPGHKGKAFLGCEALDITEIEGADVLYNANGIIKESEKNASSLFSTEATFFSTEGSTLSIKAMLSLICQKADGRPFILASRNVHKAFIYAGALLDFDVKWMYPEKSTHLCSCILAADEVESYILSSERLPDAVYITSPDYLGNVADIKSISAVCDKHGIPLVVDNAHGAYLAFLDGNLHPINRGAAMCCDSAHKTLPVLTGGAYLHISKKGEEFIPNAEELLALHASTSPSYLIMQSLDLCNSYLDKDYRKKLSETIARLDRLKDKLTSHGFKVNSTEPLKLTLSPLSFGYTGEEISIILSEKDIYCEFADKESIVMMFTPENDERDFEKTEAVLMSLEKKDEKKIVSPAVGKSEQKLSLRQAVLSKNELISIDKANGRICASPTVSCPPAVPIAVSGEIITEEMIKLFRFYGIEEIKAVAE